MNLNRRVFTTGVIAAALSGGVRVTASTPVAVPESAAGLNEMLSHLPGGVLDAKLNASWVNIRRQFEEFPGTTFSTDPLLMPGGYSQDAFLMPGYIDQVTEEIGFTLDMIDQAIVTGEVPYTVQVYQLNTDPLAFVTNWENAGYEAKSNDAGDYWTIGETGELNLTNPVNRFAFARLNNIAILPGNVIATSSTIELLTPVMKLSASAEGPSLADDLFSVTPAVPAEAVVAWFQEGELLQADAGTDALAASNDAVGLMPPIRTIVMGVTAGAAFDLDREKDNAIAYAVVEADSANDAEQIANVATWRFANMTLPRTGQPYADVMEVEAEVISDSIVLLTSSGEGAGRNMFAALFQRFELLPLMFEPTE